MEATTPSRRGSGICRTFRAIWVCWNGFVVTWGHPDYGGDSSGIQDLLKQVEATQQAFAAILSDGSAITWGVASYGGDSSQVQHKLRGVKQVRGTDYAFAAILADGFVHEAIHKLVVTALEPNFWPRNVQQLQATKGAFAAVLA